MLPNKTNFGFPVNGESIFSSLMKPFEGFDLSPIKMDVEERETDYLVTMDVPGYKKEDITLSMEDGVLQVLAQKKESTEDIAKNYICKERKSCSSQRTVRFLNAKDDTVDAVFEDGVLTITIAKEEIKEEPKKNTIKIK